MRFNGLLRNVWGLAAVFLSLSINTSQAEDADTSADLQCLVAIMETAPQIEKVAPGTSQAASMYFLGRIDGRAPKLDLETAIRRLISSMSRKDIAAADVRCGKLLTARGRAVQAIGEHLIFDPQGSRKGTGGASHAS